jgi:hypothetical protein
MRRTLTPKRRGTWQMLPLHAVNGDPHYTAPCLLATCGTNPLICNQGVAGSNPAAGTRT